jgi:hypothetical protein
MNTKIQNPATCDLRFLNVKNVRPAEIHIYMIATNDGNVKNWCWLFKEGKTNVHDEERSEREQFKWENF